MVGGVLDIMANKIDKQAKDYVANKIRNRISNTINSFYHKEIESEAEYVCVSFLHAHKMNIKERIKAKKKKPKK